jgi:hypothetical protein
MWWNDRVRLVNSGHSAMFSIAKLAPKEPCYPYNRKSSQKRPNNDSNQTSWR